MRDRQWLTSKRPLGELTAGSLLGVLRKLVVAMDEGGERSAWLKHLEHFKGSTFFDVVKAAELEQAIGALNKPLHEESVRETRRELIHAGEKVVQFLRHLRITGLYPRVVSVSSWTEDAYGRRLIRALDDSGETHTIFTMDQLEPGHLYFMHPTTNPIRVNPLLVRLS